MFSKVVEFRTTGLIWPAVASETSIGDVDFVFSWGLAGILGMFGGVGCAEEDSMAEITVFSSDSDAGGYSGVVVVEMGD